MKSPLIVSLLVLLVAACEGEPPKAPSAPVPSPPVAAEPAPATEPAAPVASSGPMGCGCPCGDHAAGGGGAAAVATDAPPPAPPPSAAVHASIRGVVTTTPANVASLAVVWLEDGPKDDAAHPPRVVIDNTKMTFAPFIQVVPAGGKVVFNNSDPFPHNVFSPDHEKFNMGNIAQKSAGARVFDKPGTYTLLCNLHPGMIGYLVVTPSSAFARADAKGHFTIKDIPAGTYNVTAWAPRQKPVTQSVVIRDGDADVSFELHR